MHLWLVAMRNTGSGQRLRRDGRTRPATQVNTRHFVTNLDMRATPLRVRRRQDTQRHRIRVNCPASASSSCRPPRRPHRDRMESSIAPPQ